MKRSCLLIAVLMFASLLSSCAMNAAGSWHSYPAPESKKWGKKYD